MITEAEFTTDPKLLGCPKCGKPDYPAIRATLICPLCLQDKDAGSLVCWNCYRENELRYGMPNDVHALLDQAERKLNP